MTDPRQFLLKHGTHRLVALTSLSWLLPVELKSNGREVVRVHYDLRRSTAAAWLQPRHVCDCVPLALLSPS